VRVADSRILMLPVMARIVTKYLASEWHFNNIQLHGGEYRSPPHRKASSNKVALELFYFIQKNSLYHFEQS
jgi:hypothetical protein